MVGLSLLYFDPGNAGGFLAEADGNVRAALLCWGLVLSAFIMFRVPREVMLGCLVAAAATVGIAAAVIDTAPVQATAASAKPAPQPSHARYRFVPSATASEPGRSLE